MPVDFTRRPIIPDRRNKALRIIIGIMLFASIGYMGYSIYTGNVFGIFFPIIHIIFIYLLFPGWFKDFFNWVRIFGTFKIPTKRSWRNDYR